MVLEGPSPTHEEVREALSRALASKAFIASKRSAAILAYVADIAVREPGRQIKEHELGAEALGRGARFDPRIDPIARVEASRLRSRLELYYATEGAADPVHISLPKGGYLPSFQYRPAPAVPAGGETASPRRAAARLLWPALWFAAGAAAFALLAGAFLLTARPEQRRPATFEAALGSPGVLADLVGNSFALSPDGQTLVTLVLLPDGVTRLFARRLDSSDLPEARELPGTDGATEPFMSPDGRWVGFFQGGKIRKTLVDGGSSPITLAEASDMLGASWTARGEIIASVNRKVAFHRLPDAGGSLTPMFDNPQAGDGAFWPQALPDGRGIVFTYLDRANGGFRVEAARLDGSERKVLAPGAMYGRYDGRGGLLYVDRGVLFAVAFDPRTFETSGTPRVVARDVAYDNTFGQASYDISANGTLVYLRSIDSGLSTIRWLDGGDKWRPILDQPARYLFPRISPDGRKLVYAVAEGPQFGLWLLDFATGAKTRLSDGKMNEGNPVWLPDSRRLIFLRDPGPDIAWREIDGSGHQDTLLKGLNIPWSISSDGARLAYHGMSASNHFDLWTVPIRNSAAGLSFAEPAPFLETPAIETYPAFSPDGRWISYASNESGEFEIYVRGFPDNGRKMKLSAAGGRISLWSGKRQEIFFTTNDHRVMVAPYTVRNGAFVSETPRPWSSQQLSDMGVSPNFDVAPDGRSIVALAPRDQQRSRDHLVFVLDYRALLRKAPD